MGDGLEAIVESGEAFARGTGVGKGRGRWAAANTDGRIG
jgi:hypothetical protein